MWCYIEGLLRLDLVDALWKHLPQVCCRTGCWAVDMLYSCLTPAQQQHCQQQQKQQCGVLACCFAFGCFLLLVQLMCLLLQVLGDVGALADCLADEGAGELRGRQGNANLAALLAGSVYRCVRVRAIVGSMLKGMIAAAAASAIMWAKSARHRFWHVVW